MSGDGAVTRAPWLTLKLRCVRQGRAPLPPPPWPLGPEPWLSLGWGIIAILCVSGQGGHCCRFLSPHKSQARPACCVRVSVAGGGGRGRGGPSLLFLPPTPEGHAESACLPEATALTSGLGQVKGPWVTQHQEEKAEESLTGGQRELLFKCQDILAA